MKKENLLIATDEKRIYKEDSLLVKEFSCKYSKANILNEALNHARVEETDLNVPKLHAVGVHGENWSITLDYIDGTTLEQLIKDHPEKEDEYVEFFVDLQREVLARKVPMLNKLKDKMNAKISAAKLDATTRYELHTRLDSMPKHTNLCHGDFNPSNIIITKDGTPYIIDWAHATQGNASADVARSYLLFYLNGQEKFAEKYLKLYCKKSDTAIQYVQRWIPIVAASRLTASKVEEEEFLRKWIDVVEYE